MAANFQTPLQKKGNTAANKDPNLSKKPGSDHNFFEVRMQELVTIFFQKHDWAHISLSGSIIQRLNTDQAKQGLSLAKQSDQSSKNCHN
jgi:hypothetical protein